MIVPIDNCSCCFLERDGSLNAAISNHGIQTFTLFLNYAKLFWSKVNEFFHFRASWMERFCKGKGKMDKKRRTCVVKGGKIGKLVVRCNHHKNFLRVGILSPNKISLRRRHLIFPRKISSRNKMTKYLFSNTYFTNPCFPNPNQSMFYNMPVYVGSKLSSSWETEQQYHGQR